MDLKYYRANKMPKLDFDKKDVAKALSSTYLLDRHCYHIVDKNASYNTTSDADSHLDELNSIKRAYDQGHTIIAKQMENFTKELTLVCKEMPANHVDVHMYVSPADGTAFDFHKDETNVFVYCVYGLKTFYIKDGDNINEFNLKAGDWLFIQKGVYHKAKSDTASCILSFGLYDKPIKDCFISYFDSAEFL